MRRAGHVVLVLLLSLLAISCTESRPEAGAWESEWNQVRGLIPEIDSVQSNLAEEECEHVLASLREEKDSLFPTPDPAIDDAVTLWVETAESAFFECPPSGGIQGFEGAYATLQRLESEVAAVLGLDIR